ncbi:hypothetical protein DFH06DRAFT_1117985 [Mycena polygramma]|nr:hypothetical protein DFH06DRAFT_1117985 [Mycena polygramma]
MFLSHVAAPRQDPGTSQERPQTPSAPSARVLRDLEQQMPLQRSNTAFTNIDASFNVPNSSPTLAADHAMANDSPEQKRRRKHEQEEQQAKERQDAMTEGVCTVSSHPEVGARICTRIVSLAPLPYPGVAFLDFHASNRAPAPDVLAVLVPFLLSLLVLSKSDAHRRASLYPCPTL